MGPNLEGLVSLCEEEKTPEFLPFPQPHSEDTARKQEVGNLQARKRAGLWSWTSNLQSRGKINFCCLSHTVCGILLWHWSGLIQPFLFSMSRTTLQTCTFHFYSYGSQTSWVLSFTPLSHFPYPVSQQLPLYLKNTFRLEPLFIAFTPTTLVKPALLNWSAAIAALDLVKTIFNTAASVDWLFSIESGCYFFAQESPAVSYFIIKFQVFPMAYKALHQWFSNLTIGILWRARLLCP